MRIPINQPVWWKVAQLLELNFCLLLLVELLFPLTNNLHGLVVREYNCWLCLLVSHDSRSADATGGVELVRRMHLEFACGRLHAWPWFMETDFGQSSIQARPSAGGVLQYCKACSEWNSRPTRPWRWTAKCLGYLCAHQFAFCLAFRPRTDRCRWRVFVDWNYRSDRGEWPNACLASKFAKRPSRFEFCREFQSERGQCEMASRPSKFNSWGTIQSEPWQCILACRPSKLNFWVRFQSEPRQCVMACKVFKACVWGMHSIRAWTTCHGKQAFKV